MWLWLFLFLLYFNCVILDGYMQFISVMYSTIYVSLTCNLMLNYLLYTRKKSPILTSVTYFYICTNREGYTQHVASFPGLPCLLFWFAFSVIHRSRRLAAILKTNSRAKKSGGGLGTRLHHMCSPVHVQQTYKVRNT